MDERESGLLCIAGIFLAILLATTGIMYWDNSIQPVQVDEGYITAKEFQNDGGWGSSDAYVIELNGTSEWVISKEVYNTLSIGDYVIVYYKRGLVNRYIVEVVE